MSNSIEDLSYETIQKKIKEYQFHISDIEKIHLELREEIQDLPEFITSKLKLFLKDGECKDIKKESFYNLSRALIMVKKYKETVEKNNIEVQELLKSFPDCVNPLIVGLNKYEISKDISKIKESVVQYQKKLKEKEEALKFKENQKTLISSGKKVRIEEQDPKLKKFKDVNEALEYYSNNHDDFFKGLFGADQYQDTVFEFGFIDDVFFKFTLQAEYDSTKNVNGCHRYYFYDQPKETLYELYDYQEYTKANEANLDAKIKNLENELQKLKSLKK